MKHSLNEIKSTDPMDSSLREFRIGLDVSFLGSASGVGTVTAGIVQGLIRHDAERRYLLLSNALPESVPEFALQQQLMRERTAAMPDTWRLVETHNRQRMTWVFYTLPKLLKTYRPNVYHAMDAVSVPRNPVCPIVLTVHDIAPITHPHFCRMRDSLAARVLIPRALKLADVIIADSFHTAKEIIAYYPRAEDKVHVVYLGVDRNVFNPASDRDALAVDVAIHHDFYSSRFLLCVVTLNPRRNLPRLIRAFSQVACTPSGKDICLVVAGCRGWNDSDVYRLVRELNLEDRVHFPGFASEEELVRLYQSALALVHPSLLEGFGFPVLEAMACGTPVTCSKTTSLGEITGDAALHFDPESEGSIREALDTIVREDGIRRDLSTKGLEHVQAFTWEKSARLMMDVYSRFL